MGTTFSNGITYNNTNTFTIITAPSITLIDNTLVDIKIRYSGNQKITRKTYKYYNTNSSTSVPTLTLYNSIANSMSSFTSTNLSVNSSNYIEDVIDEPLVNGKYFIFKDLIISNSAGNSLPYTDSILISSSIPTVFYLKISSKKK